MVMLYKVPRLKKQVFKASNKKLLVYKEYNKTEHLNLNHMASLEVAGLY